MATGEGLADQFEEHRVHLRTVAYRMLGSASEAEDAVEETWIRLGRTDVGDVASLRRCLTTVVARVCLDMLLARTSRREDSLDVRRPDGRLFAVIGFTIANGRIAEMNILADPDRLRRLDLSAIER